VGAKAERLVEGGVAGTARVLLAAVEKHRVSALAEAPRIF
jgi:hypothetical protein